MGRRKVPVRVVEAYRGYVPPVSLRTAVVRLLSGVPKKYLVGLDRIVLTGSDELSRARRRKKTWSRKRKVAVASCRGLYHEAWKGEGAWIELFVDQILAGWVGCALTLQVCRDSAIAETLFHEIGHHIHKTQAPEHTEREDVADKWARQLRRRYSRRKYWHLRPLGAVLRLLLRLIPRHIRERYGI